MSPSTILLLQSLLIGLQMFNGMIGISVHLPPVVAGLVSAVLGAFQFYVQHLGNQADPKKGQ